MTKADTVEQVSAKYSWLFPVLLAVIVLVAAIVVSPTIRLATAPATAVPARLTWALAAMLLATLSAFAIVTCNTLMFRCGDPLDAWRALVGTSLVGLITVAACYFCRDWYLGPNEIHDVLKSSALCLPGVRTLSAVLAGLAIWVAILAVATSCVIVRLDTKTPADLSRQLRGSKILMNTSAALLIAGVAETSALHKWPATEPVVEGCSVKSPAPGDAALQAVATSVSATVGTVFSMVLAAAYLPLAILLRQRAYRVIKPWERTEAWLAIHGFGLLPTQQLANALLIFSPLIAGGPVSYLLTLLSRKG